VTVKKTLLGKRRFETRKYQRNGRIDRHIQIGARRLLVTAPPLRQGARKLGHVDLTVGAKRKLRLPIRLFEKKYGDRNAGRQIKVVDNSLAIVVDGVVRAQALLGEGRPNDFAAGD